MAAETSRHAWSLFQTATRQGIAQARPMMSQWMRNKSLLGKAGLAGAVVLLGLVVVAGMRSGARIDRGETQPVVQVEAPQSDDHETVVLPVVQDPVVEETVAEEPKQPSRRGVSLTDLTGVKQPSRPAPSQRAVELAQRRQQIQLEWEQAAAEYESAVQQWNAEVAACQQNSPPPGYTSHQMGQLRAMGYRQQPRQPNQALLYAAQQAEQRYLQARDRWQQVSQEH